VRRYPWIEDWTPVNEPLTTARFSGLYGHWYPHARANPSFVRALLQQIHATVLAMAAIRAINPRARLVQTEDLGYVQSTPLLRYQAEFENERRWLSFDLLCGRVDRHHPLWGYLIHHGAREDELLALVDTPCPPDIVGINAYITSERYLDDRWERYPPDYHGGNGRHRYADVESVRAHPGFVGGFLARLRETHARYGLPMAITETHLGCSREEQLRWLQFAWDSAQQVRAEGGDVRAVTVWAAFGSTDWNSLVTTPRGHYEPGLWDVRAPRPRPTALATMARELATEGKATHPLLAGPGWWERADRHHYHDGPSTARQVCGRPVLITGATGTLGRAFARLCVVRGIPYRLLRRQELELGSEASIRAALDRWSPWAVINTAGYVRVDDAERDARQWQENALGPVQLAQVCAEHGTKLLTFSSDLVFDGRRPSARPYVESDRPAPLNAYGRAKQHAEQGVLAAWPRSLVIRTAAFFGPWDAHNFAHHVLRALRDGQRVVAAGDQVVSPTYVPHLAEHALDLLVDDECGLWHLANRGAASWADFARRLADAAELRVDLIEAVPGARLGQPAARPAFAALGSERGWVMPSLEVAIDQYLRALAGGVADGAQDDVLTDHGLHPLTAELEEAVR
jgi:dTDP-4-dehydrorhamnose reductase